MNGWVGFYYVSGIALFAEEDAAVVLQTMLYSC